MFKAFTNRFEKHKKSLVHLATGAGKTYITMEWLSRQMADGKVTTQKPIVWTVHRSTLIFLAMRELFAILLGVRAELGLNADAIAILGHALNRCISNGVLQEGENNKVLVYFTTRQSFVFHNLD